ncbi:MAG: ClpXP protease specificity-enhancing factor, partial [Pseudomonadota bacterium]
MTSLKPYYIRAIFEWILDNELTPYLLVDASENNNYLPKEYVKDGQIVFNITPGIVQNLNITNKEVEFDARFSGRKRQIYVSTSSILAIYAKENGRGMVFNEFEEEAVSGGGDAIDASANPQLESGANQKL